LLLNVRIFHKHQAALVFAVKPNKPALQFIEVIKLTLTNGTKFTEGL